MHKLLLVVSEDFGELGNALFFAAGNPPSLQVQLLLPVSCRGRLPEDNPIPVQFFDSRRAVEQAVTDFKPDAVLFFSGYLLAMTRCLSLLDMCLLTKRLQKRRIPMMTTDPFDGLLAQSHRLSLSALASGGELTLRSRMLAIILKLHFFVLHRLLRKIPQLYPARDRNRPWCYYNPGWQSILPVAAARSDPAEHWLFVLSEADLRIQAHTAGLDGFVKHLAKHLGMVSRPGRRLTVIAPERLARPLGDLTRNLACDCLIRLPFPEFLHLLASADKVFYWNYFSFSVLFRMLLAKPTLFFHQGHMADIMPGLLDSGIALYYRGWYPPLQTLGEEMTDEALAACSEEFVLHAKQIHEEMSRSPTPQVLIERLLAQRR